MAEVIQELIRFWKKVRKYPSGCWLWLGRTRFGYGEFDRKDADGIWRPKRAHIVSYEACIGKVPHGKELDHLCRNPRCVNPSHLEPVTHAENILRGESPYAKRKRQTHCLSGHEFTTSNTLRKKNGTRACRECRNLAAADWRRRHPDYMKEWHRANGR